MLTKRMILFISLLVSFLLVLVGCASQQSEKQKSVPSTSQEVVERVVGMVNTATYKKTPPWTIGVSTQGEVNSWQINMLAHIRYGLEEKYKDKVKQVYYAHGEFDANKQINAVEDLLAKNIDLLILLPANEAALVSSIEKAMNKGVPVVLVGASAFTDKYVTYVDRNNAKVGFVFADWLAKKLNGKGTVAVVLGAPGNSYTEDVLRGAKQAFAQYPEIKLLGPVYGKWSPVEAKKVMETLIKSGQKIDGVLVDGGQMALGVIEAFQDAKIPVPPLTADDWNGFLKKAKELNLDFVLVNSGADHGLDAVDIAVRVLNGEPVPHNILTEPQVYTAQDIAKLLREDLSEHYWAIHKLPESWINKLYKK